MSDTTMNLEAFNPTVAELKAIVKESQKIAVVNIENPEEVALVKDQRIKLRDARVAITKKGKELREDALKFQKDVITKEKELVAIIEPEEERLSAIEEEAKVAKEKKDRIATLPTRKEKLAAIGDGIEISDDEILAKDPEEFQAYCNQRLADKNAKDAEELGRREKEVKDKEEAIKREEETKAREEKARQEERERADREAKDKEAKIERERLAAIEAEKAEKERLEKEETYQAFLKEHGYTESTKEKFHITREGKEVRLYTLAGTLTLK